MSTPKLNTGEMILQVAGENGWDVTASDVVQRMVTLTRGAESVLVYFATNGSIYAAARGDEFLSHKHSGKREAVLGWLTVSAPAPSPAFTYRDVENAKNNFWHMARHAATAAARAYWERKLTAQ